MKKLLLILICLGLVGCATTNVYGTIYNEAITKGISTVIIKEGDFEDINTYTVKHFESLGYKKVLYSSPKQGFMVVIKDVNFTKALLVGDPHMYKIILKYTKAGESRTRIDLVNGTKIIWAKKDVDRDIRQISKLIENE